MSAYFSSPKNLLDYKIGADTIQNYAVALGVFILVLAVLRIIQLFITKRLKKQSENGKTKAESILNITMSRVGWPLYVVIALSLGTYSLNLPPVVQKILNYLLIIAVTYAAAAVLQLIIHFGVTKITAKRQQEDPHFDASVVHVIGKIMNIGIWVFAVIIILQNFGYNISALIAGLGIGGVALAFGLQNILGDIFAAVSIYLDKPFQVGDTILIGDDMGVVRKIGLRSTRLESLQGQELIMSNKELTSVRVHNFKRMQRRRVIFRLGVVHETSTVKLKRIPEIMKKIFESIPAVTFERANFREFAASSLNFEIAYFLNSGDYLTYIKIQEDINYGIKDAFEKEGIQMVPPVPAQTHEKMA
ncbi:MAG: mechanosensitive ion channel family protein [Patescibacteria group bacterium]|mgnify:CR=1 FL=1